MPTLDRRAQLPVTLTPLLVDDAIHEVVVVDDGSSDGTLDYLTDLARRTPRLRVVRGDGRGKGRAEQLGLAVTTGEVVLLLDDDVVAEPGLGAGHLRHHERRPGLVVIGYMPLWDLPDGGGFGPSRVYQQDYERVCSAAERSPDTILHELWGGNVSLRRADAVRVGLESAGHDPRWRHIDRDFGLRCLEAGLVGMFDRALLATHHYERRLEAMVAEARWQALGRAHLHERHAALLGPLPPSAYVSDLSAVRTAVVRVGMSRWGHAATIGALTRATRLAARFDRVAEEIVLTRLLRRTEQGYQARRFRSADGVGRS